MQPEVITLKHNIRKYRELYMRTADKNKKAEYKDKYNTCKVGLNKAFKK